MRDIEQQKRTTTIEAGSASRLRQALENEGVVFTPGSDEAGPGVRLVANRPNLIRRPSVVTAWDGVPAEIELAGKHITIMVSREVLEDLGRLTNPTDAQLIQSFERHMGEILDAAAIASKDSANYDRQKRLFVRAQYFKSLQ